MFRGDDSEFFWQELTEEEIADRVVKQLDECQETGRSLLSIEKILQNIGTERSKQKEIRWMSKWLAEPWRGTARIHWAVSCAYIACPLSSLLVLVVAMEWGIRGSTELPMWFKRFPWYKASFLAVGSSK